MSFKTAQELLILTNSACNGSEYIEAVAYGTLEYKKYSSIVSSSGSIFTPTLANFTDNDRTTSGMTS